MHAVSQGALGIESRSDDLFVIKLINSLNHEETLLRCIAERTFLAKLEGGCSAPIGVTSHITQASIVLEGGVFDLEGLRCVKDKFEMRFDGNVNCPLLTCLASTNEINEDEKNETSGNTKIAPSSGLKRKNEGNEEFISAKRRNSSHSRKHYSFIVDVNVDENKMIKAELCGLHLAEKLKELGADILINEAKLAVHKKD